MKLSRILQVSLIVLLAPAFCQAQGRWDKFQQKMEEFRPKGKLIQQIKDGLEGEASDDNANSNPATQQSKAAAKPVGQAQSNSSRRVPAKQVSGRSILNTARKLPSGDVVLGIQVDPAFLPAQRLVISEVEADSPAHKAGIRTGDQITSIGGISTNSLKALDGVLNSLNAGDQVVIEFVRNRKAEKTLVRFEKPVAAPRNSLENQLESGVAELPPTPDVLDTSVTSPGASPSEGLHSVLSATPNANLAIIGPRRNPSYFPADAGMPQVVGNGGRNGQSADDLALASPDQLRARIREQQLLIEHLQQQLQQVKFSNPLPVQVQADSETLIIDPNGN